MNQMNDYAKTILLKARNAFPTIILDENGKVIQFNNEARQVLKDLKEGLIVTDFLNEAIKIVDQLDNKVDIYEPVNVSTLDYKKVFTAFIDKIEFKQRTYFSLKFFELKGYETNHLIRNGFQHTIDAILLIGKDQRVIAANDAYLKLFKTTEESITGKHIVELEKDTRVIHKIDTLFSEKSTFETLNLRSLKDIHGETIYCQVILIPSVRENKVTAMQITYRNITENQLNEHKLSIFKKIIHHYNDGVIITDESLRIVFANEAFLNMTKFEANKVIGRRARKLLYSGYHNEAFYQSMWQSINTKGYWQGEMWDMKQNGVAFPVWLQIFTLIDEETKALSYVGIYKDLSDFQSRNKRILLLLEKDPLTAAYNRTYFLDKVDERLSYEESKKHYILFMDVNDFKQFNDSFGHSLGDEVLMEISRKLFYYFSDSIIARYGGDEFIIHIEDNMDLNILEEKIKSFINFAKESIILNNRKYFASVSIGISMFTNNETVVQLINEADQAMYQAKKEGKAYKFFDK